MAYCVHCGVKLGAGETKCPLCGIPVHDPLESQPAPAVKPYPIRTPEQDLRRGKKFFITLAALLLLGPALLCFLIDLLLTGGVSWSVYPMGALTLLFITAAVPILAGKYRTYLSLATGFATLSAYLRLVEAISGTGNWFYPIVLPALALGTLLTTVAIMLYRCDKLNKVSLLAVIFAFASLECLAIECLHTLALDGGVHFSWSPFAVAPCLFISLALFFINGNRSVREEVRRRVHF